MPAVGASARLQARPARRCRITVQLRNLQTGQFAGTRDRRRGRFRFGAPSPGTMSSRSSTLPDRSSAQRLGGAGAPAMVADRDVTAIAVAAAVAGATAARVSTARIVTMAAIGAGIVGVVAAPERRQPVEVADCQALVDVVLRCHVVEHRVAARRKWKPLIQHLAPSTFAPCTLHLAHLKPSI